MLKAATSWHRLNNNAGSKCRGRMGVPTPTPSLQS